MLATRYGAISPARSDVTLERIPTVPGGQAAPVVLPPEVHLDGFLLRLRGYLRRVIAISASFRNVPKIVDPDGLANVVFSYQWVRVDGANERDISGATGSTYTLVAADVGKRILVKVL